MVVKATKWILIDSIDSHGQLHYDRTTRALLTHCNTPVQGLDMSPAMTIFQSFATNTESTNGGMKLVGIGEKAMAKRHLRNERQYDHSHLLQEKGIGQPVQIQNQTGPYPLR